MDLIKANETLELRTIRVSNEATLDCEMILLEMGPHGGFGDSFQANAGGRVP